MKKQEVINNLLAYKNLNIVQRKDMFNFSLDTVLLADFCTITKDVRQIMDFGTNNAAIPLLLSTKTNKRIVGVEIQEEAVAIAIKSVQINNLDKQIEIRHDDIRNYLNSSEKYELVLCNPPFFKSDEESNINDSKFLQIARHEILIDLETIVKAAARILENKGRFAMVHRPTRILEIMSLMQKYEIEPKRIRFVYPKKNKEANVLLIEGIYKGNSGLTIEPPLFTHNEDGSYSDEVKKIFGESE